VQGASGTPGPQGVTGPTGPFGGPTGPTGAAGVAGTNGPTGPTGMAGSAGTAGSTGPTGPSGPSCVDFVINSQADLQAIAPHVSNEHILSGNGTYCFGSFAMTAGRKIVIPSGAKVELKGHGTTSLLQGDIDGPILLLRSGSVVHLHDMKLQNTRTTGTPRSLESDTTEAYIHDIAIMCEFGEGVRVTSTQSSGSRFFATQLRISNCQTGISCRGGEVFLNNYDCEALTRGVSIDGSHGGLQWIGGRCGSYTYGLRINAACYSILLHGVTATSGSEFVRYESGSIDRVNIMGNTVSVTTTAVNWNSGAIPADGLVIVGNNFDMNTPFGGGFSHTTGRVNSKANTKNGGLMQETPIVT
jgi:hypothetical protein